MRCMKQRSYTKIYLALAALTLLVLSPMNGIIAQEEELAPGSGQGLEISPPLIELEADPGDRVVTEISVRNITDIDVIASGDVRDFLARGETGEPRILLDTEEESPFPLAEYVESVPDLTIEPTEQETAEIVINVPEDASPGGHFGVVRFSGQPADPSGESSAVALSASIGTLVLLNVSGDVEESMSIEEMFVSQEGEQGGFFETGPFEFVTRLSNEGNVYLQPSGELEITNIFGQEVASIPFNEDESNVLPQSIRRFDQSFDDKSFWFGRYTATADLQYGASGEIVQDSTDFWVIPYKLVGIVLVMLLAVGYFGRKALQAYNKSVVKKYQSQNGS